MSSSNNGGRRKSTDGNIVFVNETEEVFQELSCDPFENSDKANVKPGNVRLRKPLDTNEFREHFFLMKLNKKGGDSVVIHARKKRSEQIVNATNPNLSKIEKKRRTPKKSTRVLAGEESFGIPQSTKTGEGNFETIEMSNSNGSLLIEKAEREKRQTTFNENQVQGLPYNVYNTNNVIYYDCSVNENSLSYSEPPIMFGAQHSNSNHNNHNNNFTPSTNNFGFQNYMLNVANTTNQTRPVLAGFNSSQQLQQIQQIQQIQQAQQFQLNQQLHQIQQIQQNLQHSSSLLQPQVQANLPQQVNNIVTTPNNPLPPNLTTLTGNQQQVNDFQPVIEQNPPIVDENDAYWTQKIVEIINKVQQYSHTPSQLPLNPIDPKDFIDSYFKQQ
ncbi:hypothetical protein ABK040_015633 [Willaertia magna]